MVEQSNNNGGIEEREIKLFHLQPSDHVRIITDISPYNDIDTEKYFTGYSFEICEDTLNCFYGGALKFDDNVDEFSQQVSQERKDLVLSRLIWLSSFEYTPIEIKDEVKKFVENFLSKQNTLNTFKNWRDVIDQYIIFIRDREGVVQKLREDERYKEDIKYYKQKNRELVSKNENGGLRVT